MPIDEAAQAADEARPLSEQERREKRDAPQGAEDRDAQRRRIELIMASVEIQSLQEMLYLGSLASHEVSENFSQPRVAMEAPTSASTRDSRSTSE